MNNLKQRTAVLDSGRRGTGCPPPPLLCPPKCMRKGQGGLGREWLGGQRQLSGLPQCWGVCTWPGRSLRTTPDSPTSALSGCGVRPRPLRTWGAGISPPRAPLQGTLPGQRAPRQAGQHQLSQQESEAHLGEARLQVCTLGMLGHVCQGALVLASCTKPQSPP